MKCECFALRWKIPERILLCGRVDNDGCCGRIESGMNNARIEQPKENMEPHVVWHMMR